jgi:DNA processing protein
MPVTELDDETEALIVLSCVPGIGATLLAKLVSHFGSGYQALHGSERELVAIGLPARVVSAIHHAAATGVSEDDRRVLQTHEVAFLRLTDDDYPPLLRHIYDAPPLLYLKGSLFASDIRAVTIVGSRRASDGALKKAYDLAHELARNGVTIVSGFAVGIDAAAHEGALDSGGRTVAVMGHGLAHLYPPEHKSLAERVVAAGALLSEFPMSVPPIAANFPRRNRVLSGLSLVTVVIEAPAKSGALRTADFALEQGGREVFAVPWERESFLNEGSNRLLREGAHPCRNAKDVLDALTEMTRPGTFPATKFPTEVRKRVDSPVPPRRTPRTTETTDDRTSLAAEGPADSGDESVIWNALRLEPTHIDALIQLTGLAPSVVATSLVLMEMKGIVRQYPGKRFARRLS